MSETFERNLAAIRLKNAALAKRLASFQGGPVVLEAVKAGGLTFRHMGIYFHSPYDARREAEAQAAGIASKKPDWVMLFGLGCGYLLRALLEKGITKVMVYEPSLEILSGVLKGVDLSGALGGESVFIFDDIGSTASAVRDRVEGIDTVVGFQSAPYRRCFPAELGDYINKVMNAHTTNKVSVSTEIQSRLKWVENYFTNFRAFFGCKPIDLLRGRFSGVPLVIAGAGPSLEKNAGLLRDIKGKALIFSAITAYKILLRHGVEPDLVIASEKTDLAEYFTGGPEDRRMRLVLGEVSHPNMFGRPAQEKFLFFNKYIKLSQRHAGHWGSDYLAVSGGSVTTTALDMGVMFGCNPIIFVGQDLCFTGGKTHADGGFYDTLGLKIDAGSGEVITENRNLSVDFNYTRKYKLQWLKGLDGGPVPSKFDWVTFHQWFENRMKWMKSETPGVKVINATEGGAYIEGMEHITLREAIERHVGGARVEEVFVDVASERPKYDIKPLAGSLNDIKASVEEVERISAEIVKEARRAKKGLGKRGLGAELSRHVERIRKLEERLFDSAERTVFIWEALVEQTYRLKEYLREEQDGDAQRQFEKDLDSLIESYTTIGRMCSRFMPVVGDALEAARGALQRAQGDLMETGT